MKPPKNVAASVRQRLLNRARVENRPFNELLQYFAMERFLYRLSQSDLVDSFILKGALMLRVWRSPELRPTMDIDMLGRTTNDEAQVISQIQNILSVDVENDGLVFDPDSILAEQITEDADYEGFRIRFLGSLGVARINMQIDIGYGDIVYPEPEKSDLPTILDFPAPSLFCYSRESSIAEKLEAMVKLGALNSRMKDFYDIWLLSRQFNFDGEKLAEAIRLTFERREASVPMALDVFNEPFVQAKQVQWTAFRRRLKQDQIPDAFAEIAASIERFLFPIVSSLSSNLRKPTHWTAPGTWD